ncbi:hypothetical protein EJ110_NYTH11672 [Nymphaea thermarum]|nr:hypothetical protein EJ110_NYTH11672 [Nymphaea thermarum]
MAKAAAILICILVVALDVTAGILGIEAEVEQNKQRHIRVFIFECKEPSREALRMGIAAATLLLLAHVVATMHGGCICIFSREELAKSPANRQLAAFLSLFSWIILAIGFSLLIVGALANRHSKGTCGLSHHKMLSTGGILCFVHVAFILGFYVTALGISREEEEKVHKRPAGTTQMTEGRHGPEHI